MNVFWSIYWTGDNGSTKKKESIISGPGVIILTGIVAVIVYLTRTVDTKVFMECVHNESNSKYFFENMQYQIIMDDEEKSWLNYKDQCDSLSMIHGINITDAKAFKDEKIKGTDQGIQMWRDIMGKKFWLENENMQLR